MRPHSIRPLLATTALVFTPVFTLALSAPAFAQEAVDDAEASVAEVAADSTDDDAIYVTARRREEQSQDIPLAISVVDGEQLDNTGAFNVGRLQQLTPTVQYYSSNPRNTSLSIRGIGAPFGLTNDGFEQGVGIYVDDIYYSRVASATFDFLDVAQIEVLRGPQGTLYGRNVTGGAVLIRTNAPSDEFEIRGHASYETGPEWTGDFSISGPLAPGVLSAKLAVYHNNDDGWFENDFDGSQHGDSTLNIYRLALRATPSDSVAPAKRVVSERIACDRSTRDRSSPAKPKPERLVWVKIVVSSSVQPVSAPPRRSVPVKSISVTSTFSNTTPDVPFDSIAPRKSAGRRTSGKAAATFLRSVISSSRSLSATTALPKGSGHAPREESAARLVVSRPWRGPS